MTATYVMTGTCLFVAFDGQAAVARTQSQPAGAAPRPGSGTTVLHLLRANLFLATENRKSKAAKTV